VNTVECSGREFKQATLPTGKAERGNFPHRKGRKRQMPHNGKAE